MFFFNVFQELVEKKSLVVVELKNDLQVRGTLESIDQFLNIKLSNVQVTAIASPISAGICNSDDDGSKSLAVEFKEKNKSRINEDLLPHLAAMKNCFIRGSVVRYIHLGPKDFDTVVLQNKCRKEMSKGKMQTA